MNNNETTYTCGYGTFKEEDLKMCFDMVCDKENWKNPIDCVVDFTDAPREEMVRMLNIICAAIEFYTSSDTHIESLGKHGVEQYRIQANGYYLTVGA